MTTVIAIFTGILTICAVYLAFRQLKAAQPDSAGKRMAIAADRLHTIERANVPGLTTAGVSVEMSGPATLYGLRAQLVNVGDGETRRSPIAEEFTCHDELRWEPELPTSAVPEAWIVITWARPRRDLLGNEHLMSDAVRTKIGPSDVEAPFEIWHYKRFFRMVKWYHQTRRWYIPGSGQKKPLGRYRPYVARGYDEAQGPAADPSN